MAQPHACTELKKLCSCKMQNSGLRSKEGKLRDPMNQSSRCNMQEGLLSAAQTGDSDLLGGRAHRTANWASFYRQKTHYQHVTYGLQSDWLHVCKAILLVQTSRAFCSNVEQSYWYKWRGLLFKLRRPWAFYWVHIDGLTPGHPMGAENPTISRETETQVPAACQPQPRQPHIIKLISQLQKPTRKISDTWVIDTDKRETRYQLVKVHQTIRRPHNII